MTPTVMIWGTNKYEISDLLYQILGGTTNEPDPWVLLQIGRKCIGWVQGWVRSHQVDRKVRCARRQVDRKGQPYYTRNHSAVELVAGVCRVCCVCCCCGRTMRRGSFERVIQKTCTRGQQSGEDGIRLLKKASNNVSDSEPTYVASRTDLHLLW